VRSISRNVGHPLAAKHCFLVAIESFGSATMMIAGDAVGVFTEKGFGERSVWNWQTGQLLVVCQFYIIVFWKCPSHIVDNFYIGSQAS
jgi:hypothetical protein